MADRPQRRRDRRLARRRRPRRRRNPVWGLPLVRGAVAATAELDEQVVDQAAVNDGRFTLVAVDAVHGFGDDHYLRSSSGTAAMTSSPRESLYDDDGE